MKFTFSPIKTETLLILIASIGAGMLVFTQHQVSPREDTTHDNEFNQAAVSEIVAAQSPVPSTKSETAPARFYKSSSIQDPVVSAAAALVVEANTGHVLFEKNPNISWPMASITKLMTAVVVSSKLQATQAVAIPVGVMPDQAQNTPATPITAGAVFTVADLIRAMVTVSSNEAAEALAGSYGRTQLIAAANAQAKAWGMYNTHFDDPTGLSVANQSTAHDLAILARHILTQFPALLQLTTHKTATITDIANGTQIELTNINQFAGRQNFVGGKTGYTDEASGNLLSIFNEQTEPIITIVLGTTDRFGQTSTLLSWFEKAFTLTTST